MRCWALTDSIHPLLPLIPLQHLQIHNTFGLFGVDEEELTKVAFVELEYLFARNESQQSFSIHQLLSSFHTAGVRMQSKSDQVFAASDSSIIKRATVLVFSNLQPP